MLLTEGNERLMTSSPTPPHPTSSVLHTVLCILWYLLDPGDHVRVSVRVSWSD